MAFPKFNPKDERQFKRLISARNSSYKRLESFRRHNLEAKRQFVGAHYGPSDIAVADRVPVNFIELAVNIYLRQLASSSPSVIWNVRNPLLKPTAKAIEGFHNYVLKEIAFATSLRLFTMEGLFSQGIFKVGITDESMGEARGFRHDAGQVFADPIFLDDWCHDMTAGRYEQVQYACDRYQVPIPFIIDTFKLSKREQTFLRNAHPDASTGTTETGEPRVDALSKGQSSQTDEPFHPVGTLWDIWLPLDQLLVTVSDAIPDRPLRVIEWTGPEIGPYHRLTFEEVGGNIMPLPPVALLRDLHELGNRLFLKLGRQAQRQKSNIGYRGGAEKDAERLKNALDGEYILMNDPEALRAFKSGGIDQANLAFFLQVKDLFAWFAGNLDAIGGLGPQADTLGQDQLLTASASRRLEDMKDRTYLVVQSVQESIGDYLWNDPNADYTSIHRVGGPGPLDGVDVPIRFSSDTKEGDLLDYNVEILPNSMQQLTPAERLRTITQAIERFYIPLAQQAREQGVVLDIPALLDVVARYTGVKELRDIIVTGQPVEPIAGPGRNAATQSPVTTRTNIRRNIPGASRSGKDDVLARALIGSASQSSETAAVSRPVG